jgi:regulator of ribonuclease activity A
VIVGELPPACVPSLTGIVADGLRERAQVVLPGLRHYGGRQRFQGAVETLHVADDNRLVRLTLEQPGDGRVLVIDAGASPRCAITGPTHAELCVTNGWAGIVVNGHVRYTTWLAAIDVGVMALGSMPRQPSKHGHGTVGEPVSFLGVRFARDAYVYADEDGITVADRRCPELEESFTRARTEHAG